MAYCSHHVQMAKGWVERIEKENKQAEKFWTEQALKNTQAMKATGAGGPGSVVTSVAPSGYTSKTSYLKSKLEMLESELQRERECRKKVEEDLLALKSGTLGHQ